MTQTVCKARRNDNTLNNGNQKKENKDSVPKRKLFKNVEDYILGMKFQVIIFLLLSEFQ